MKTLHLKCIFKFLVFLFLLPFLGCSTGAKQEQVIVPTPPPKKYQDIVSQAPKAPFEHVLESTKGKDIEYMTDRLGFPAKSFEAPNKNRVFEYDFSNIKRNKLGERLLGGLLVAYGSLHGIPLTHSTPIVSKLIDSLPDNLQCVFWLEVNDDDVIRKWRWKGKDCEIVYQKLRQTAGSKIHGAWLGVEVQVLTSEIKKRLNIDHQVLGGVFVNSVISNSPAQKSGILRGDVITEINRKTIYSPQDLLDIISKSRPGGKILILLFRNGRSLYVSAILEENQNPTP